MSKKKKTKATKNVQSRLVDVNQLENPKSRIEEYLHFINNTGKIVDINQLPKPQSRVEWLLLYLCENIGNIGGGGGQPFNGVTNVRYNAQTKELVVTYSNNLIDTFNLANLSDVTDVQYNDNTHIMTVTRNGVATQIDLSKLNTKINNVAPVNGNIQLALNQAGDDISLTVGGQDAGTVSLNGYVKTVNNQPNQGGNVTVDAEHINYNTTNTNLNHQNVQDVLDYLEGDKASLYKDNLFTGNNTFDEVFLTAKEPYIGENLTYASVAGGDKKAGRRDFTSHSNGNGGYVKSLLIRVSNGLGLDATTHATVWEVEKGTTVQNDRVVGKIVDNKEFSLLEKNGVKYIEVQINKKYTNETYFIYQINPSTHMAYANVNANENVIYFDKVGDFTNQDIVNGSNQPHSAIYWIVGDDIDVRKKLSNDFVSSWKDLEYAEEYPYYNLIEYNKRINESAYTGNGDVWENNQRWSTVFVDVVEGEVYTVFRKRQDSNRFIFTNSIGGQKLDATTVNSNVNSNGFNGRSFTVPRGKNITKVAIMFQHDMNGINDIMMFEGNVTDVPRFIPYADKNKIQIGKEVSLEFDNSNSNIKSTTVESAIKEVNDKIANVGGGTVTSINGVQPNGGEVILIAQKTQGVGQDISLQVGNQNFVTLECMTDQDADLIIAGFTL